MKLNFSLFPNKNKTNLKSPDYWMAKDDVIEIREPGVYRLFQWTKPMKDGRTYLSCSLEKTAELPAGAPPSTEDVQAMLQRTRQMLDAPPPTAPQGSYRAGKPLPAVAPYPEEELPF